ncbi:MAG: hypothetical protein WCI93_02085 [bacterium]
MMNQEEIKKTIESDSGEIAEKAKEAFKEFELEHKINIGQDAHVLAPEVQMDSKNIEIENSLKEFELKQKNNITQKKIENPEISDASGIVGLLIKYSGGAIKNKEQANYLLLSFVVIVFLISGYLFIIGIKGIK